jgi:3-oxoacyl-[acyl-carrier protein] reductase
MAGEQSVLVTGGARGIGRSIAQRLAEGGWNVIATYFTGLHDAKELARTHNVQMRQVDLADRAKTVEFAHRICDEFSLNALVNNAGILEKQPFEEMTLDAWDRTLEVNVTAPLILAQTIGPRLSLVAVSSILPVRTPMSAPTGASPTQPVRPRFSQSPGASPTCSGPAASGSMQ